MCSAVEQDFYLADRLFTAAGPQDMEHFAMFVAFGAVCVC